MDITEIIFEQHAEQRRLFAWLDDVDDEDVPALSALWRRLDVLLETHADSEEQHVYPALLHRGDGSPHIRDDVEDAVKDHNQIRDALRAARSCDVGTPQWRDEVAATRRANSDHMAEEERDDLPGLRRHLGLPERHRVAVEFLTRQAATTPDGVPLTNRDPSRYVQDPPSA